MLDYGYTLSQAGELCQGFGNLINTYEDCSAVFPSILDFIDSEAIDATGVGSWFSWLYWFNDSKHPKGCFYHEPNKKLYWNQHVEGNKNDKDRQVCTI